MRYVLNLRFIIYLTLSGLIALVIVRCLMDSGPASARVRPITTATAAPQAVAQWQPPASRELDKPLNKPLDVDHSSKKPKNRWTAHWANKRRQKTMQNEGALPGAAPPQQGEILQLNDRIPWKSEATKILILAYARSGSSFTGDLLSASSNAAYFYEPLFPYRSQEGLSSRSTEFVGQYLTDLFSCMRKPVIELLRNREYRGARKGTKVCRVKDPIVVKTIRAHSSNMLPWILDSDIKVVHLIRDPRGMFSSLAAKPDIWDVILHNITGQCDVIANDMALEEVLPKDRYYRVRYEDLVDNMIPTLEKVYDFMGVSFGRPERKFAYEHTHQEPSKNPYYSTFRGANFTHDSWKHTLTRRQLSSIEQECASVMQTMNYELFPEEEVVVESAEEGRKERTETHHRRGTKKY